MCDGCERDNIIIKKNPQTFLLQTNVIIIIHTGVQIWKGGTEIFFFVASLLIVFGDGGMNEVGVGQVIAWDNPEYSCVWKKSVTEGGKLENDG